MIGLLLSCSDKKIPDTRSIKRDTIEIDGGFFSGEQIVVTANDSVVFNRKIESDRKMINVHDQFVILKSDTTRLSVQTFLKDKKHIDTTFILSPSFYVRSIGGSICYPPYLSKSSVKDVMPNWGYLPPDSCKRYISIQSDSAKYVKY